MIQQYLLLKVKKQSVKQPKKSETCWRIIIILQGGFHEQQSVLSSK